MLLLAAALAIQVNVHPSLADEYQLLRRPTPDTLPEPGKRFRYAQ